MASSISANSSEASSSTDCLAVEVARALLRLSFWVFNSVKRARDLASVSLAAIAPQRAENMVLPSVPLTADCAVARASLARAFVDLPVGSVLSRAVCSFVISDSSSGFTTSTLVPWKVILKLSQIAQLSFPWLELPFTPRRSTSPFLATTPNEVAVYMPLLKANPAFTMSLGYQ